MKLVASFWEEHCCECGMPVCYRTCEMFERGWHGRCIRVDDFRESVSGVGRFSFRRWGKVELMFHGSLLSLRCAAVLGRLNRLLTPIYRLLGAYHRALRWRIVACIGCRGIPNQWCIRATSVRDERLFAVIAYEDGREVFRREIMLKAGRECDFRFALPSVEDRALFRLFPANGEATGVIDFAENSVGYEPVSFVKCLAWDLDDTLWDGTLVEDGVNGCALKPGIIELLKVLDSRGIVNSIVSRNDPDIAIEALRHFGIEEYFVFPQFGWGAKSEGLKRLSKDLNISLSDFAFVDDRQEQRNEVIANLPEVRVYDAAATAAIPDYPEFSPPISIESAARRSNYRSEMSRRQSQRDDFGDDYQAFLEASQITYELLPVSGELVERCRELVNRTNQLTISGHRYSEDGFCSLLSSCQCLAVHVWDRYGDYGTVGFIAKSGNRLHEMCFSCRVAKKGIERRVLTELSHGENLIANCIATDRNQAILEILKEFL